MHRISQALVYLTEHMAPCPCPYGTRSLEVKITHPAIVPSRVYAQQVVKNCPFYPKISHVQCVCLPCLNLVCLSLSRCHSLSLSPFDHLLSIPRRTLYTFTSLVHWSSPPTASSGYHALFRITLFDFYYGIYTHAYAYAYFTPKHIRHPVPYLPRDLFTNTH